MCFDFNRMVTSHFGRCQSSGNVSRRGCYTSTVHVTLPATPPPTIPHTHAECREPSVWVLYSIPECFTCGSCRPSGTRRGFFFLWWVFSERIAICVLDSKGALRKAEAQRCRGGGGFNYFFRLQVEMWLVLLYRYQFGLRLEYLKEEIC